ncbi:hypothetical protein QBC37DRAFT_423375 [Rhypophila decipiens]|uniref:Uncharacterized protein n=1 Tax=Rhypophila decipiens TaxID=261697 RepID=A0AAN6Y5X6_9PEZI|nr:hypothetical protein QBC37DRAFT_423375 [Rhypophila decipiens]
MRSNLRSRVRASFRWLAAWFGLSPPSLALAWEILQLLGLHCGYTKQAIPAVPSCGVHRVHYPRIDASHCLCSQQVDR